MANATVRDAKWVHSTNPQFLIDQVLRTRIYGSRYWKEQCFALDAASILDRAVALQSIGGTVGATQKPTAFLSLTLKLLQLQPQRDIVLEYLGAGEFKYLQALAALYIRLTFSAFDIYDLLEPLLEDYRKLRYAQQSMSGITESVTLATDMPCRRLFHSHTHGRIYRPAPDRILGVRHHAPATTQAFCGGGKRRAAPTDITSRGCCSRWC